MQKTLFGTAIRTMRESRGISQYILAGAAGIGQPTISRIETGRTRKPKDVSREKLLQALNGIPRRPVQGLFFEVGDGNGTVEKGSYTS